MAFRASCKALRETNSQPGPFISALMVDLAHAGYQQCREEHGDVDLHLSELTGVPALIHGVSSDSHSTDSRPLPYRAVYRLLKVGYPIFDRESPYQINSATEESQ